MELYGSTQLPMMPNRASRTHILTFWLFTRLKIIELQIYVSNFGNFASVNLFKKNIFIGNPNLDNKKKFDVYIPAKTPGIDKKGIAVRSDGISVIKLKKFIDSSYNSIEEIFNRISGS